MTGPQAPDGPPQPGSWDGAVSVAGQVLLYGGLAALVLFRFRGDTPLTLTALYLLMGAAVGAVLGYAVAGWRYAAPTVVAVLLAGTVLLGVLMDRPPLGVFVVGYLVGLLAGPKDEQRRAALRAR